MIDKIKTRLASDEGFTLIELLVVIVILGILVAIAVPAYLSFRGSAQDAAAKANVRSAVPAVEGYYQASVLADGTTAKTPDSYSGVTATEIQAESPGVASTVQFYSLNSGAGYCIDDTEATGHNAYYIGGNAGSAAGTGVSGTVTGGNTCTGVGVTADS